MVNDFGTRTAQDPAAKTVKRLSRDERIHRRRMLALQRRAVKGEAVTSRD